MGSYKLIFWNFLTRCNKERLTVVATCWRWPPPETLNSSVWRNMYSPRSTFEGASLGTLYQRASWQWVWRMPMTTLESHNWPNVKAHCLKIETKLNIHLCQDQNIHTYILSSPASHTFIRSQLCPFLSCYCI